jgi:cobyric acid synthase
VLVLIIALARAGLIALNNEAHLKGCYNQIRKAKRFLINELERLDTYMHGLFHNAEFTRLFLNRLRALHGLPVNKASLTNKQKMYDKLADIVRNNLHMSQVYDIIFGRNNGRK